VVGESLARLAEDAIVFEHARSTSSWTRTAAASLLTGLSPQRHRVFDRLDIASAELLMLAEVLQGHGYQTLAWSGNPNVLATWGFAQGFDEFVDLAITPYESQKTDAVPMFDAILKKVDEVGAAAVFYYLHLMDPHNPYLPPPEIIREVQADQALAGTHPAGHGAGQGDLPSYESYLAEIVDVDAQLGRFLDVLVERGLYDESVVLVTSDHGEEFGDHGGRFHGRTLFEEVLRVVGILKLPGGEMAGLRVAQPVDLADLMPAVLRGAGLPVPEGLDGRSPLEGPRGFRPRMASLELDGRSYTSVLDGEWKLILQRGGHRPQLFDLSRDPQETENLFEARPDVARRLGSILVERRASYQTGWHVRGCGVQTPSSLEFHLFPSRSQPRPVRFESNDELVPLPSDSGTQGFRARLDLQPRRVLNTRYVPPVPILDEDEDEVVLAAPQGAAIETIRLAEAHGGDLLVSLGSGGVWIRTASLTLDGSTVDARVAWNRPIACYEANFIPSEHAGRPYLRIWHEESVATSAKPEEIGPELRSRLRALGYAW
jgi:arylsulfatase A-like enzyme